MFLFAVFRQQLEIHSVLDSLFLNVALAVLLALHNSLSIKSLAKRYFLKDVCIIFILDDDINLNSTVFHWPNQIERIVENSRNLLCDRRNQAEIALLERYGVKTFSFTRYF